MITPELPPNRFATYTDRNKYFIARPLNVLDMLAVLPFYVEIIVFFTTSGSPPPQFLALKVIQEILVPDWLLTSHVA